MADIFPRNLEMFIFWSSTILNVGDSYNKPKSEDAVQPQCPPEKEEAIKEALKYFGMI